MILGAGDKLGPYEILAHIGAGGMGEVYRALDTRLHRTVAIKVLPHDKLSDAERKRRFLQEARAASALMHPNIVVVHDVSNDGGIDFLVMEYVAGKTLKERIREGALPASEVVRFGMQIASALAAAHAAGIVHRDIKPANIMVTAESQIKVLDFGLAKLAEPMGMRGGVDTLTMAAVTEPGMVVGTVAYMSPEQTRGEALDGRSDIFSLGCVLYEAATATLAFQGPSTLEVMHRIATIDPPAPSEVSRDLPRQFDQVISKALAKDKNERYGSASEMMEALRVLDAPSSVSVPRGPRKSRWWLAAAAGLFIAAGAVYEWGSFHGHTPNPEAYQLYLQGRRDISEFTDHGFRQSIADFTNAIARDPEYAAAYAGLADAYSYQASFELKRPAEVMPLAQRNALRAIEKDPRTAEAYTSSGIVALAYEWDFPLAEQRFRRAIKLNPKDAFTQHFLGHHYEFMGNWPEALHQMELAHDLDKLSPMYGEDIGYDLLAIGRYDDALRQLRETAGMAVDDPYAHTLLAMALEAKGLSAESLEQAQKAAKLPGMFSSAGSLGGVFCRLHRPDLARDLLKRLEDAEQTGNYISPFEYALLDFALGDKAKGLARLRESLNEKSFNLGFNIADPEFDLVREDPEFAAMMNEMHLPPGAWRDIPRYRK